MPSDPHSYYTSFAEELLAKFRRVGHLVSHPTTTGNYHEEILRVALRNFLSKRYSVKTGFIYKNEAEVSRQVDILIVDENDAAAYLFQEGDFAIVRPRSVAAAIEVKTYLGKKQFLEALKNIASVRKLEEPPNQIHALVFGYASPRIGNARPFDSWFKDSALEELRAHPHLAPELIAFLEESILLMHASEQLEISNSGQFRISANIGAIPGANVPSNEGWLLEVILALIWGACLEREYHIRQKGILHPEVRDYNQEFARLLTFSGAVGKTDHFEFGRGYVAPGH